MTLENCKLYLEQAKTEEDKKFWSDRIARKYPETLEEKVEKPKKKKIEKVEDGDK